MLLSDAKCKSARQKDKPWKMADGAGMYLEIMPNGSKYWRLKYRMHDKEKRLSIGVYPEISLLEAREKRDQARKMLRDGVDPSQAKKDEKRLAKLKDKDTFKKLALEWHEHNKGKWSDSHAQDVLHRMTSDLFPLLGNKPVSKLTPPEILFAIRKIEDRGAHELARRSLQYAGRVFRYGIATGLITNDPTRDLKDVLTGFKKGHFAAIEVKELPDFLEALNSNHARLYVQTIRAIRLLMLTFVRTSELINVTWDEIDFDNAQWIIPGKRMKRGRDHIVPLSKQALSIFKEQQTFTGNCPWVFPNIVYPRKSMSNNTILMALKRMGYAKRMTGHGFRSLAMTAIKEELGYRHEVIDRQLAHAPANKTDKAYDRAAFLKERKKMMQDWGDYLDTLSKK